MNVSIKKVIAPIKKILIHLNILSLVIMFIACGSDNPVNNGNNPSVETPIFSIDSLVLRGSGLQNIANEDTVLNNANNDSLKVTFTVSTNCDNTDNPFIRIATGSYGGNNFTVQADSANAMNQTYTGYFKTSHSLVVNNVTIIFNSATVKYLKVSNIKVYKL